MAKTDPAYIFSPKGLVLLDGEMQLNDLVVIDQNEVFLRGYVSNIRPLEVTSLDDDTWDSATKKFMEVCKEEFSLARSEMGSVPVLSSMSRVLDIFGGKKKASFWTMLLEFMLVRSIAKTILRRIGC